MCDGLHQTTAQRRELQEAQRAQKAMSKMSDAACRIILVRHGETLWNVEHRLQGQEHPGPELNELGQLQAMALARNLLTYDIERLYTSDLLRTLQTTDAILVLRPPESLPTTSLATLRERNLGILQGLTYLEVRSKFPEAWKSLSRDEKLPGGGESATDVFNRVIAALEDVARNHPGDQVLVVSHGGPIHAAHRKCMGGKSGGTSGNCSINELIIDASQTPPLWAALKWNDMQHLKGIGHSSDSFGGGVVG